MGAQVEDERNNVSTSDRKGREILVRVESLGGEPLPPLRDVVGQCVRWGPRVGALYRIGPL
jgi:hypothetical protein